MYGIGKRLSSLPGGAVTIVPVYAALIQYKYKEAITESEAAAAVGIELVRKLRDQGFRPRSYALCAWSSDYHGWWVFEVHDLQVFQKVIRDLRYDAHIDKWLDMRITIGTPGSTPSFSVKVDQEEIQADGVDASTFSMEIAGGENDSETVFTLTIVEGEGTVAPDAARARRGEATARLVSQTSGEVKVLISSEGSRDVGVVVPIKVNPVKP